MNPARNLPALPALLLAAILLPQGALAAEEVPRPRLRDLGIEPGILAPGPLNAITDVAGVRVGHTTLIQGDSVRTGVTAILPHEGNLFQEKVPAAVFPGNAYGKAAGFLQVVELGNLEVPIVLTNTLCVGTAVQAVVDWTLAQKGNEKVRSVNAVVGETNDGTLNDIRHCAVKPEHVARAIVTARSGAVEEGSVGAGTGTWAFDWKGGIGTASRILREDLGGYTVGALVQSNFGGILMVDGLHVGEAMGHIPYQRPTATAAERGSTRSTDEGSCMIVLATDAPLSARNLERMAKRAVLGMTRTGSFMHNGSGDFVIAFSTANRIPTSTGPLSPATVKDLPNGLMSPLFLATVEAVEEAVLNSLTRATTVTGHKGRTIEAIPVEKLREMAGKRREAGLR